MRINLKRGTLAKDSRRNILKDLVGQLIDDYDLDSYGTVEWIKTKPGLEVFITYLTEKGYKVKTYHWPTEKEARSAGLEFDDNDPNFIALRLRHSGDDNG